MFSKTMTAIVLVLSAIVVTSASQANVDSVLTRRIDVLDAMVANLQKRVTELERQSSRATSAPSAAIPAGREAWRRLTKGMSMADVRSILGEPERVDGGNLTYWRYKGSSHVIFGFDNRVYGWQEP